MKSKAAFNHLLEHYRAQKIGLPLKIQRGDNIKVAMSLGALDSLYWQALGNGLTNLAKGIHRTITHSYQYHQVRLPCHIKRNKPTKSLNSVIQESKLPIEIPYTV
ncbi:MAG: hypothetical protein ACI9JN_002938 [Bacteroidia bacterium]|jgi:hypothetical protein